MPDHIALVLAGGGARAAYQVGVIAAIAEAFPETRFTILTGVSAGAINAAFLGTHRGTPAEAATELRRHWKELTADRVYRVRATRIAADTTRRLGLSLFGRAGAPVHLPGLLDLGPLRQYLAGAIRWDGVAANLAEGRLRALALTATPYTKAASRTFVQGVDELSMWRRAERVAIRTEITLDHVMASSAIPVLFPAVWLDGEFYGDGSVRQTAPLAPAIHLGASRVLVIGMQAPRDEIVRTERPRAYPTIAEGIGLLFSAVFHDALEADVERLDRINRLLAAFPPEVPLPDGLRPVRYLHLFPSRYLSSLVPASRAKLPGVMRWVVRALGGVGEHASVFLSYLLFDPSYTGLLVELGYEDARRDLPGLARFLADEQVGGTQLTKS